MDGLNRFLILLLLLALLYALYRYQQQLAENESTITKRVETSQKAKIEKPSRDLIDMDSIENISLNNISQISLGSLDDGGSAAYKQDSVLDSIDSNGSFSLLDDNSRMSKDSLDSNFFFR